MNIVFCTDSLNTVGGVPAVTIRKANALADVPGNKVWIITCCDNSLLSFFPVSDKVNLMGIKCMNNYPSPKNWFYLPLQVVHLRRSIKAIFRQIEPDIVVSAPRIEKWIVASLKGKWCKIIEYHNRKHYRIMKADSLSKKIGAYITDFFNYCVITKCFDRIVVLTNEDKDTNWKRNDKVVVIPNPSSSQPLHGSPLEAKRVIAIGRLVKEKNLSSLISAFAYVKDRFPDWKLDILGEGYERPSLEKQIAFLSLEDSVFLRGTQTNVPDWLLGSSIFVMTSRYEGLPLVLLEAINYGLPVVSYAFSCGPRDVISDGQNGFLVPEGDEKALAYRICQLIEDNELRKRMGAAAFERAKDFSIEKIMNKWMSLFKELTFYNSTT